LDLEPWVPLDEALWPSILTQREGIRIRESDPAERGLHALAIFCAKEAAYKCQYPLTRMFLEFEDVEIGLDVAAGSFTATIARQPNWARSLTLSGQLRIVGDILVTVARTHLQLPLDGLPVPSPVK
jgi:4'-phosphopantetheinyl transferase EntD